MSTLLRLDAIAAGYRDLTAVREVSLEVGPDTSEARPAWLRPPRLPVVRMMEFPRAILATATGTVTYHLGRDFEGSVTIRGAGLDYLRFDANLSGGVRSEVTNQGEVRLRTEEGAVARTAPQAPIAPSRFMLPYLLLAPVVGSPGYTISYKGLVQVNGKAAHDVRIQRVGPSPNIVNPRQVDRSTVDFFIDASTFQVLVMLDGGHGQDSRRIEYADYRVANGVLVPFSVHLIGAYSPCSIKLDSIAFNSGWRASDFNF